MYKSTNKFSIRINIKIDIKINIENIVIFYVMVNWCIKGLINLVFG